MSTPITARELHSRANDGISVQLLWCEHDDRLWLDVFHHPFGYAACYGIDTSRAAGDPAPAMSAWE